MSDVLTAIKNFPFLKQEKHIVVALSGGADSMALLNGLYILKEELSITLSAVHINHNLRGEESNFDQEFVKNYCNKLSIPLLVKSVDVKRAAKEQKISIELAARQLRYQAFEEIDCDAVATAHNADDNIETVIFRLTRATGIGGLCGIPLRRGKFIRPLLNCTRQEIETFCKENSISYVTDSTNLSDQYTRNKIRHNLVPVLKELNPSLFLSFSKTLELLNQDNDYLSKKSEEEFNIRFINNRLNIQGFNKIHPAISSRVIELFLKENQISGNNNISGALKIALDQNGRFNLSGGEMIKAYNGFLYFENKTEIPQFKVELIKESAQFIKENKKIHNLLLKNAIDCDKIVGKLNVRTRLSGDNITFSHRKVSKTIRKWMNEENIEPSLRNILPVIADDIGVVWVYGGGVDKRVCPDQNTKTIFRVLCERTNSSEDF